MFKLPILKTLMKNKFPKYDPAFCNRNDCTPQLPTRLFFNVRVGN